MRILALILLAVSTMAGPMSPKAPMSQLTPFHTFIDVLQKFDTATTNAYITLTALTNSTIGDQTCGWKSLESAPFTNWFVATNIDLPFLEPFRVPGGQLYASTGTKWLRYNLVTNGTENIQFMTQGPFGEGPYTNMTVRFWLYPAMTNIGSAANLDIIQLDGSPWCVSQLLTGGGNAPNTFGAWSHAGGGNSSTAVGLTNFHYYFFELKRISINNTGVLTVRFADGTTNGVPMVATMSAGFWSSWSARIQANYLVSAALPASGYMMIGGLTFAYSHE